VKYGTPTAGGPATPIEGPRRSPGEADTRIEAGHPGLAAALTRTRKDLAALQVPDPRAGRAYVAAGAPWFMTLFGRDSLLTAGMALPLSVEPAVGTLQALAATQGRTTDPATEEQRHPAAAGVVGPGAAVRARFGSITAEGRTGTSSADGAGRNPGLCGRGSAGQPGTRRPSLRP